MISENFLRQLCSVFLDRLSTGSVIQAQTTMHMKIPITSGRVKEDEQNFAFRLAVTLSLLVHTL